MRERKDKRERREDEGGSVANGKKKKINGKTVVKEREREKKSKSKTKYQ